MGKYRKIFIVAGLAALAGSIFLARYLSGLNTETPAKTTPKVQVNVPVIEASPTTIVSNIDFTGRVISAQKIDLFSEVVGVLQATQKPFKAGIFLNKGDTLIHLEMQEEMENLTAQKFQFAALLSTILPDISLDYPEAYKKWNDYLLSFNVNSKLPNLPKVTDDQLRLFLISNDVDAQFHQIKREEIRMEKFTILAPFDGTVTESLVNPGALVQTGQQLGSFQRANDLEIEASIDVDFIPLLSIGDRVDMQIDTDNRNFFSARVIRINQQVDDQTQTVLTYLKPESRSKYIRPGQFVDGFIKGRAFTEAVSLPLKSIVMNQNVFIVDDSVATLKPVTILTQQQDSVMVRGLQNGDLVIDEFYSPAFEGTPVAPIIQ